MHKEFFDKINSVLEEAGVKSNEAINESEKAIAESKELLKKSPARQPLPKYEKHFDFFLKEADAGEKDDKTSPDEKEVK